MSYNGGKSHAMMQKILRDLKKHPRAKVLLVSWKGNRTLSIIRRSKKNGGSRIYSRPAEGA